MTMRFWLRNLFARPTTRPIRKAPHRFRPALEVLEDRFVPATLTVTSLADTVHSFALTETAAQLTTGQAGALTLRDAINVANNTGGANTLVLAAGATYDFARVNVDNFWYGPNALPAISSAITIQGNGAILARTDTGTTTADALRFFYVSGGLSGLAAGNLTLDNLTLQNGLAKGGDSYSGGGGMGTGGAIFAQGNVTLDGVTLSGNQAVGGSSGVSSLNGGLVTGGGGGGGIGADGTDSGGGFGGPFPGGAGGTGGNTIGDGGGGGGFTSAANAGNDNSDNGGAGGGMGGLGGNGGQAEFGSLGGIGGDGGGGGGTDEETGVVGTGGDFGFGGVGGDLNGSGSSSGGGVGGGGFGGGGGASNGGGGSGGFGGGGGSGFGGAGVGGFGGGSGGFKTFGGGGGGGGFGGAIFVHTGQLDIINSTLSGNSASGGNGGNQGGGGSGFGGGVFNLNGTVVVLNSTIANNTVTAGSGGTGGTAGSADGGALYNLAYGNQIQDGTASTATATLSNSILASSVGGADLVNNRVNGASTNSATVTATDPNIIQAAPVTQGGAVTNGGTNNVNPLLAPLFNYGGPTQTMFLLPGSPAIDAGTNTGAPSTDQRGLPRPVNGTVDIGAVEVQPNDRTLSTTTATGGTFTYNGNAHAGSGSVDVSGGVVTLFYVGINGTTYSSATAPTNAGTYTVTATYAGDDTYFGSSASATLTVTPKLLNATASSPGTINIGSDGVVVLHLSVAAGQLNGSNTLASLFNGATFTIAIQKADGSVTYATVTATAQVDGNGNINLTLQMNNTLKAELYDAYVNGGAVNFDVTATANGGNYALDADTTSRLLNNGAHQYVPSPFGQ